MSLTIDVIRGLGDNPDPNEKSCSFFSSELVFFQVGRVEIDKSARGMKITTITLPGMRKYVRPGLVVQIIDYGRIYRGKVINCLYSVGRDDSGKPFATCSMTLRMIEIT